MLTPMMADGVATTALYGTATTTRTGDTVYGFNNTSGRAVYDATTNPTVGYTVYDNGGTDTLDYSGFSQVQSINLNAETFSSVGGRVGNVSIARGVVIENAIGGSGNDTLTGNAVANVLDGKAGNDTLNGGAGNDILIGGAGADTLNGGESGADVASYETAVAAVTVDLSDADGSSNSGDALGDTFINITRFRLSSLNDTFIGAGANDVVNGGDGNDNLQGGGGNDKLNGGLGDDSMSGGTGNDNYFVDAAGDVVAEELNEGIDRVVSTITWTLGDNVEYLTLTGIGLIDGTGNALNNTITGNASANTLAGGEGNDSLNGDLGDDSMLGGTGNDTYYVDAAGDAVTEASNEGTDRVFSTVTFTLGDNVENLTLTGAGLIDGTGNALNNTIVGNASHNVLTGGEGNDALNGGLGDDEMLGGAGNDTYYVDAGGDVVTEASNEGIDRVVSTVTFTLGDNVENLILMGTGLIDGTGNALNNALTGNASANTLTGGDGNDSLNGGGGIDQLLGGAGNDKLVGGLGDDSMSGGADNDTYYVDATGDVVTEASNEGFDRVFSTVSWTLGDNVEYLTLTGTDVIDATGNALSNRISGNASANTITGGAGNDVLSGGGGADRFVFALDSIDQVVDFASGVDHIVVSAAIFGGGLIAAGAVALIANSTPSASGTGGQFLYDTDDGRLWFDADGQGGVAAIQFATLTGHPTLSFSDFEVIA